MFETVVLAYDFSHFSERAMKYVIDMKKVGLKRVIVVTVVEYESISVRPISRKLDIDEYKRRNEERLLHIKEAIEDEGLEVETVVEYGIASKSIIEIARNRKADIIVIGAMGTGFSNALIGSTAQNIIKISDIPVLIVPSK